MSSPDEFDSDFVRDSFAEISQIELSKLEGDEQVRKLIASPDTQVGSLNYGGSEIRFRLFLSKSLRHKMMKGKTELENAQDEESLAKSEKSMYVILGNLCIDEPWNHWETWAYMMKSQKVLVASRASSYRYLRV